LAVGGVLVPATYLQPWSASYYQQFSDPRMQVVAHAVLAPSGHNMQPWTVRLDTADPNVLYLYTDPTRLTPAVDPLARQTLVSQGTFLAYLQVAAEHLGYSASLELFPDGTYDESNLKASMSQLPVARVTLAKDSSATTADYASLFLSDTNRAPYTAAPLTPAQTGALTALADSSPATLSILSGQQVEAGILYALFCLHARTLGLVMQPLSQVLQEYPTMAAPYAAIHAKYAPGGQTIQMLVRMGTATPQYPVTMRRDANALVHTP
jgi:hypothetical protein